MEAAATGAAFYFGMMRTCAKVQDRSRLRSVRVGGSRADWTTMGPRRMCVIEMAGACAVHGLREYCGLET